MSQNLPTIGFFPLSYNLAETGRSVIVAKRYIEIGGKAIFFSHGGEYERLITEIGCKIIKVNPIYSEEFIDDLWKYSRLEKSGAPFSIKVLKEHVESEVEAYKNSDVKLIVTTNNFPCSISARVAKIPLISITPKSIGKFTKFPDDAESFITRLFPESIKLWFLNWYFPRNKVWSRPFNKLAKRYRIGSINSSLDISKGDYTFYTDFLELLDLPGSDIKPNEFFIGMNFLDELFNKEKINNQISEEILNHIKKPGKSILLTLGSSGTKDFYIKILNALNKTKYNVIAIYSSILSENELPSLNDNILLRKSVPSIEDINKIVDLAIIHGGKGTVYTAAYSGKPVIGFPMQFEQHQNLEMLLKKGTAKILSRKYFNEKILLDSIQDIFNNYDSFLKKAQFLSNKLPKPEGDKKALELIIDIIKQNNLSN